MPSGSTNNNAVLPNLNDFRRRRSWSEDFLKTRSNNNGYHKQLSEVYIETNCNSENEETIIERWTEMETDDEDDVNDQSFDWCKNDLLIMYNELEEADSYWLEMSYHRYVD